jgi:hypothetical protein
MYIISSWHVRWAGALGTSLSSAEAVPTSVKISSPRSSLFQWRSPAFDCVGRLPGQYNPEPRQPIEFKRAVAAQALQISFSDCPLGRSAKCALIAPHKSASRPESQFGSIPPVIRRSGMLPLIRLRHSRGPPLGRMLPYALLWG